MADHPSSGTDLDYQIVDEVAARLNISVDEVWPRYSSIMEDPDDAEDTIGRMVIAVLTEQVDSHRAH